MFSAYVVVPDPPPKPAIVVAAPSAISALPIWSSRFLPVMAATALTCPTFSAIKTRTTGRNRITALVLKVGVANSGNPNQLAFFTPSKSTSPISAA